ncbi:MAG: hypothetical protein ABW228_06185 [Thermoleophilaceae bacterium]
MGVAPPSSSAVPAGIEALAERCDPDVIDVRRTRRGAAACARRQRLGRPHRRPPAAAGPARDTEPDAVIAADPTTWLRIAGDVRAGMRTFQRCSLRVRGSLHVGVGFLAATSGAT